MGTVPPYPQKPQGAAYRTSRAVIVLPGVAFGFGRMMADTPSIARAIVRAHHAFIYQVLWRVSAERERLTRALSAAARRAAEMMNEQAVFGTIERGKRADLLVLAANPLDDIRNIRSLELVILDGEVIDRSSLLPPE